MGIPDTVEYGPFVCYSCLSCQYHRMILPLFYNHNWGVQTRFPCILIGKIPLYFQDILATTHLPSLPHPFVHDFNRIFKFHDWKYFYFTYLFTFTYFEVEPLSSKIMTSSTLKTTTALAICNMKSILKTVVLSYLNACSSIAYIRTESMSV